MAADREQLKRRLPRLDYLRRIHGTARRGAGLAGEFLGVCPLPCETQPAFYVNARKNLFYSTAAAAAAT